MSAISRMAKGMETMLNRKLNQNSLAVRDWNIWSVSVVLTWRVCIYSVQSAKNRRDPRWHNAIWLISDKAWLNSPATPRHFHADRIAAKSLYDWVVWHTNVTTLNANYIIVKIRSVPWIRKIIRPVQQLPKICSFGKPDFWRIASSKQAIAENLQQPKEL